VQTKDGGSQAQQRDDFDPGCQWTGPLVVMQSKFSASASEIFTGAMQDYKRALIIGDSRSHGKGSVQQMRDLSEILFNRSSSDLGAIKVTIQGFYRPSGVSTQRIGVKSDVVLPSFSDIMEGICEEDLDNALTLDPIPKARNFEIKTAYMTPQIADALQKRSSVRIQAQEEFVKEAKRLQTYKEIREKRSTTLNEKKYFEELERLDADKTEKDKFKEIADKEDKIKRDFYVDEVLDVAVDYLQLLDQSGIKFPQERTIQAPKQSWMDSLFGR
jgi:carboxyl-terminal processing protease